DPTLCSRALPHLPPRSRRRQRRHRRRGRPRWDRARRPSRSPQRAADPPGRPVQHTDRHPRRGEEHQPLPHRRIGGGLALQDALRRVCPRQPGDLRPGAGPGQRLDHRWADRHLHPPADRHLLRRHSRHRRGRRLHDQGPPCEDDRLLPAVEVPRDPGRPGVRRRRRHRRRRPRRPRPQDPRRHPRPAGRALPLQHALRLRRPPRRARREEPDQRSLLPEAGRGRPVRLRVVDGRRRLRGGGQPQLLAGGEAGGHPPHPPHNRRRPEPRPGARLRRDRRVQLPEPGGAAATGGEPGPRHPGPALHLPQRLDVQPRQPAPRQAGSPPRHRDGTQHRAVRRRRPARPRQAWSWPDRARQLGTRSDARADPLRPGDGPPGDCRRRRRGRPDPLHGQPGERAARGLADLHAAGAAGGRDRGRAGGDGVRRPRRARHRRQRLRCLRRRLRRRHRRAKRALRAVPLDLPRQLHELQEPRARPPPHPGQGDDRPRAGQARLRPDPAPDHAGHPHALRLVPPLPPRRRQALRRLHRQRRLRPLPHPGGLDGHAV
ncbi:MAG: Oligopeptide ABC transporter, periplasmic oligopeptide-binding protein OppA, partial [uncultured Thermomicrobiales bacterium]